MVDSIEVLISNGCVEPAQLLLRSRIGEDEKGQWIERAVKVVNAAFPEVDYISWPICERLLSHVQEKVSLCSRNKVVK